MSISWRIADGLVRIESSDETTVDEWRGAVDSIPAHVEYRRGMGVLHDFRKLRVAMPIPGMEERVNYLVAHAADFGPTRWAVVVARDVDFGMGRMAQVLLQSGRLIEIRVFRDPGEAEEWARARP